MRHVQTYAFLVLCFFAGFSPLSAKASLKIAQDKIYIQNEVVDITSHGIVISLGQKKYITPSLYQGAKGLYVYKKHLKELHSKAHFPWRCWSCGIWNWGDKRHCTACEMPKIRPSEQDKEDAGKPLDKETGKAKLDREKRELRLREEKELAARRERRRQEDLAEKREQEARIAKK